MSITSWTFIGFVFAAVILYYLIPCKHRWLVLLLASIIFYISISPWGLLVLFGTAIYTYWAALQVEKWKNAHIQWLNDNKQTADKETKSQQRKYYEKRQQYFAVSAIILNVGTLFFCKYLNPMLAGLGSLFGTSGWSVENILLPLGISYYSLQLISYILDIKRGLLHAERNPLKVVLFAVFFLSIMQGPFNRYHDLMPQIEQGGSQGKLSYHQVKFAILRILAGYIKKMCIADQIGMIANEVFSNYQNYKGPAILLGIMSFAVQLYADFSGYMDIICGIGELFGIRIPENFKQPFFSRSISEFWQKWHITLGMWLKDYVFYPILKSSLWKRMGKRITEKHGKDAGRSIPTYLGMLILWTLIGMWHGAGLNYVFSVGLLQFIYIFVAEIIKPMTDRWKISLHVHEDRIIWHIFQSLKCTILMSFAWLFFNSSTIIDALKMFKNVFVGHIFSLNSLVAPFLNEANETLYIGKRGAFWVIYIVVCILLLLGEDLLHEKGIKIRESLSKQSYPIRLMVYLAMVFAIIIFGAYGNQYVASNFIYFEF